MRHFDIEHWVDFSRGTSPDGDRSAMESHLASGCPRCRRVVDVLKGVAVIARAEKDYEPPASAVRLAKAVYWPQRPERLVARLIYDSLREPLPAGVRSLDRLARHALYEAGDYALDVRVEPHGGRETATLVGQLANRDRPWAAADDVQVMLKSRKKMIAATSCNPSGEFHLEYCPAPALRLEVSLGSTGRMLDVPLGGLLDESPGKRRAKSRGRAR